MREDAVTQKTTLTIRHEVGLHARPAALFVETAKQFAADIQVCYGERQANAKSILSMLALGAVQGAVIVISAEGLDAEEAVAGLKTLVESNFEVED